MSKLAKFQLLTSSEQRILVRSLWLLPLTSLLLALFGLRQSKRWLLKFTSSVVAVNDDQARMFAQAQQAARLVNAAARSGLFPANCLSRSLTLWWLLQRAGIHSDLRIGVRKAAAELDAHAWVECQGNILNDARDVHQQYVAFTRPILSAEAQSR